jgi:Tol biopolymer transport system component
MPRQAAHTLLRATTAALALCGATAGPVAASAFPGANGRIVYNRASVVYTVNPDGTGEQALTSPNSRASDPSLSPDGNRIAFAYSRGTAASAPGWGIWVVNANGTGAHQVTTEPQSVASLDHEPAWSPDGSKIVFVRGSPADLYVMNADGTGGSTNLTASFTTGANDPSWSPLGDKIAFSTGGNIFVMNADGSGTPLQVTPSGGQGKDTPTWSPNGTRIAYGNHSQIRAVNPTGGNDVQLLGGLREVWDVAWSPDGSRIAYVNDPGTNIAVQEELFVMNSDGSGSAPLGADTDITLDWGVPSTLLAPPVLGKTVNAAPAGGKVFVSVPASGAFASVAVPGIKGRRFVPLTGARQLPVGSILDTRRGSLTLTSASTKAGEVFSGIFSAGVFQTLQSRTGLTTLPLKGSSFRPCAARSSGHRASAALTRRVIRRMRGNASGRFRTRGRYSAATVRGTIWETIDRCDGTLTKVRRGVVVVRDNRKRRNITVRAGKSYLARAPG